VRVRRKMNAPGQAGSYNGKATGTPEYESI
jgi:hypothetical protein